METRKHTRGPWKCSTSSDGLLVSKKTGELIAHFKVAPTKHDARLIDASTQLLDAIFSIRDEISVDGTERDELCAIIRRICNTAIAKATGEKQ